MGSAIVWRDKRARNVVGHLVYHVFFLAQHLAREVTHREHPDRLDRVLGPNGDELACHDIAHAHAH